MKKIIGIVSIVLLYIKKYEHIICPTGNAYEKANLTKKLYPSYW